MSASINREAELEAKKKRIVPLVAGNAPLRNIDAEERAEVVTAEQDNIEENLPGSNTLLESWVELTPSRASLCSSVEAVNIDDDGNGVFNRDSRLSLISLQSPCVELESNLEQVKYRLVKDVAPKSNEWIWDWSSRPEAMPVASVTGSGGASSLQQLASALTTPPNSPEPDLLMTSGRSTGRFDFGSPLRPRREDKKTSLWSSLLRFEVIFGLVVSNLVTFVLGASIGFCICKMRKSGLDSVLRMIHH